MADKGIIFSAPMVRALLDGRKTQTRRLLKPMPFIDQMGNFCAKDRKGIVWNWGQEIDGSPCLRNFVKKVPYAPGDRLYVREAFFGGHPGCANIVYRAGQIHEMRAIPWKPSIHMPRWASRLWLAVSDVRVQRLQEISEADARAEGVVPTGWDGSDVPDHCRLAFRDLWNTLHTDPATRWEDNPWIYAVTFAVNHGNIDAGEAA